MLNKRAVEYLIIGGYAVGYYGYVRATADIDIWIAVHSDNAQKIDTVLREFGFDLEEVSPELFLQENKVIRMGLPPFRIELLTTISGVEFNECYKERTVEILDDVEVNLISLHHLKINKRASGRLKDQIDLEHLE